MDKNSKIYVAGHRGMVGSSICAILSALGYTNLVVRSSSELDLRDQAAVRAFFGGERPDVVIDAAARVGGILANRDHPYPFLMDNMLIQNNLFHESLAVGVPKFVFLGSSCIYPKLCPQPIKEEYLLTGSLEPTNEWYAIAKITGVKACEAIRRQFGMDYTSLMPTNLYGPRDNFDLHTSHVLPAMIRKFHEAKDSGHAPVTLWGSGEPMREFLHVYDLARAVVFALEHRLDAHLYNVGTGSDLSIRELALMVQRIVGHQGEIVWDREKPDGTPRKLLDVSKLQKLGWRHEIDLEDGIRATYDWFVKNMETYKTVQF